VSKNLEEEKGEANHVPLNTSYDPEQQCNKMIIIVQLLCPLSLLLQVQIWNQQWVLVSIHTRQTFLKM
jgi:hypothetical protein